ncbi:MAG: transglutaminase family protein [Pseudomonadales bacterium]|nr:transglutaminase family protein [Pseudomonadales bacterium]
MAIKIAIAHHTAYRFDRLASIMPHVVRLRPAPHCRTPIESYSLKVSPETHFINWQQDPFANYLARLVFPERAKALVLDVELIADMTIINPFDFFLEEKVEHFPFQYDTELKKDLAPYLHIREQGPLLMQWLKTIDLGKQVTIDFLAALNSQLQQHVAYLIRLESGVQSCEDTLGLKSGSCRDSAWLLVQILRHLGLAARFVSGYLVQLTADIKSLDGPSGPEADFTDLHAWTEVYLPGAGWVGLDPTSGLFAAEGHIPLACTPDPGSAAPVTGATSPCEVSFDYSNTVRRIHEDPRVTKPYSDLQWQRIDALGKAVDEDLEQGKVKLTMGGEPTFVSIDDMEGEEWNTGALGEKKLALAGQLLLSLKEQFGPQGFIHHGQGKWYPGEQLPRWALGLYWRTDKKTLWHDQSLLANPQDKKQTDKAAAKKFIHQLCQELELDAQYILPGYEDRDFYLRREGSLPGNVDVSDSKLLDPQERARLLAVFDQGLDTQVGFTLPLSWSDAKTRAGWVTSAWPLRRGRLFLLPGDSPMGLRLPLDSLPWTAEADKETEFARDPFAAREALAYPAVKKRSQKNPKNVSDKIIHTALCVEVRKGKLHVFMPPLKHLEHYLDLLARIEKVAAALRQPLIIEGYEPPRDPRLKKLMITPDPGVIEVNVHPAASWDDLLAIIEPLYERARQCRLGTEKFMLDGRHTGTGGGNHVTLGAAEAVDSPFLRKPELLASMLRYWQKHPSLSYLFSGQFIGPTSQAPRVDEARDDNLYELEIAMQQLPRGETDKPWLIDRILRNFLIDLTGNTHRAEFCIDKLYSPGSASGRLGLVEFRNFEMPPHWRMSAVQMLLIRSLVAWFWKQPYEEPFTRWGSQLHDRFMLPHFVWEDMKWVVADLNDAGYPFELDWLLPFQEFRFPHYGRFHVAGLQLDIHSAIEPWHVLGEESSAQGTARYVDSSVERLQVSVQGMTGDRLILCCNGRQIPLQATGREGEYVGGVRYKAWAPHSALHPTLGVHTPLVFDVVDTVNSRSLGGCTYHVAHPGGRSYETFPVNANVAEARRVARFSSFGHLQGTLDVRAEKPHPERPYTLDLRYLDKST